MWVFVTGSQQWSLAVDIEVRKSWWGKKEEEESLECQLRITRGLG